MDAGRRVQCFGVGGLVDEVGRFGVEGGGIGRLWGWVGKDVGMWGISGRPDT